MKTIQSREISWNLGNGAKVTVTVNLNAAYEGCTISALYTVEGRVGTGIFSPADCALPSNHPARAAGATHGVSPLVWTAANQDRILAAVTELESTPEWIASVAGQAATVRSDEAYDTATAKTARAMSI